VGIWVALRFFRNAGRRRKLKILGAAKDQEFGDGAEAFGALAIGLQFRDGLVGQFISDFVGAEQAKDRGIGGLLLGDIFSGGFAERGGGFLDVEDVVGDLKGQPIVSPKRRRRATSSGGAPAESAPEAIEARISAAVFER